MKKIRTKKSRRVNNAIHSIFSTLDFSINLTLKNAKNNVWVDESEYRRYLKNELRRFGRSSKDNIFGIQLIDGLSYEEYCKVYAIRIDNKVEEAIKNIETMEF